MRGGTKRKDGMGVRRRAATRSRRKVYIASCACSSRNSASSSSSSIVCAGVFTAGRERRKASAWALSLAFRSCDAAQVPPSSRAPTAVLGRKGNTHRQP